MTGKIGGKWFEKKFRVVDEFAPELDAFAAAIQTKKRVEPDGRQGHRDVIILEAIYESARKNGPVGIRYGIRGEGRKEFNAEDAEAPRTQRHREEKKSDPPRSAVSTQAGG